MNKETNSEPPPLGETDRDKGVAIAKAMIGTVIPVIGGIIGEVVGTLIPQQRIERLESYVRYLNDRLGAANEATARRLLGSPEAIDLFEDGAHDSVRALSDERRRRVAQVVADGIKGDEYARIEAKRILSLFRQLDDDQIIILLSYLHKTSNDREFHTKHSSVLTPVAAHMGSSQEELDRDALFKLAREHLVRLGLLAPRFRTFRKGEIPEFDERTGAIKAQGYQITPLGRLLLTRIGACEPGDV